MYESFFDFSDRPFSAAPEARRYFASASIEEARTTLTRIIERGDGPGLVVGPAGTGKSLLCHVLAARFRGAFDVVMLASARLCTRRALLQNILFELNLPYRDREEGELRLALIEHLKPGPRCPNGMLLLVDEAHTLPLRLLEEIRMITNLVRDGQNRVGLVLAGSSRLEERFAHPRLESFNQRLAARCYLQPMSRSETTEYVQFRIRQVGREASRIFADDAWDAIYQATDGVPRLVNQVCDHALMLAAAAQRTRLDRGDIETAWADLQRLPTPWTAPAPRPGMAPSADADDVDGVVEFGTLDGRDEPATSIPLRDRQHEIERADSRIASSCGETPEAGCSANTSCATDGEMPVSLRLEDHLEHGTSRLDSAADAEDSGSAGPRNPFQDALDPFGDAFDEEEVIVDRYATLDAASVPATTPAAGTPEPARQMPAIHSDLQLAVTTRPDVPTAEDHPAASGTTASDKIASDAIDSDTIDSDAIDSDTIDSDTIASTSESRRVERPAAGRPVESGGETTADRSREKESQELVIFDAAESVDDPAFHIVEIAQPHFGSFSELRSGNATIASHGELPAAANSAPGETRQLQPAASTADSAPPAASRQDLPTGSVESHPGHELRQGQVASGDDRDLIYVDASAEEAVPHQVPAAKAERREYRQLFARLRRV